MQSAQSERANLWEIIWKTNAFAVNTTLTCLHMSTPAGSVARNICLSGNSNCLLQLLHQQKALMYERVAVARSWLFPLSQQSAPPSALEEGALSKSTNADKWCDGTLSHLDRLTVPIQITPPFF